MSYVDPILAKNANETDSKKRVEALDKHYDRLRRYIKMVTRGEGRSLIVNGDAGMGKTEFTSDIIEEYAEQSKSVCGFLSGTLSAVDLYARLYHHRKEGQVLVIDDTDKILENTESLEVLKAATDNKKNPKLTWGKAYSSHLNKMNVQTEFDYHGKVIIITNKMLRTAPDNNPTITQQRVQPLMSRVNYFRAGLPNNQWKIEAIKMFASGKKSEHSDTIYELRCARHIRDVETDDTLESIRIDPNILSDKPVSDRQKQILDEIIEFMENHQDELRELSFRTVANIIEIRNQEPDYWEDMTLANLGI